LKRSNRLILLIGLFLAVIAFVGVILLTGNSGSGTGTPATPTTAKIVVAAQDIPLGTTITAPMVTTKDVALADKPADSFALPEAVIGQIVRTGVTSGAYISTSTFSAAASLGDITQLLDPGNVALSVQVDQVSGVGTLVKPGDRVDVVLSMTESDAKNPITVEKAPTKEGQPPATVRNFEVIDPLLNNTTVKVLVQNVQVLGTILPPPTAAQGAAPAATGTGATKEPATTLNGQSQIVILALTAQQAELVRFTQLDGNLSLVLRSPKDKDAPAVKTTGITLRQLVDSYGVIPPKIILTEQP
jgi:Flp pilus assembly protein CpaB